MITEKFRGDRLRLIRLFCGLSQEDLGNAIGATRQYIQQLETEIKSPSSSLRQALEETLGVYPNFFNSPLENDVKEEQCHFRKRRTTPLNIIRQVLARATLLDMIISEIDKLLNLPFVRFELSGKINHTYNIEETAEGCRLYWGLGINAPIHNMIRVVENAGAVVTCFKGISEKIDALSINRPRPIIVLSTDKESAARMRFDIAHEYGHLVMHQGIDTGDHATEEQANQFACSFLLPKIAFTREFPRSRSNRINWEEILEMKLRWKVSIKAIIRRAFDLQLINSIQYRWANIHIAKTGQTKQEKYDDILETEKPELLIMASNVLQNSMNLTLFDIGKKLGLKSQLIEKLVDIPIKSDSNNEPISLNRYKYIKNVKESESV